MEVRNDTCLKPTLKLRSFTSFSHLLLLTSPTFLNGSMVLGLGSNW